MRITTYIIYLSTFICTYSCSLNRKEPVYENSPDTTGFYKQRFTELFLDSASISDFVNNHSEFAADSVKLFEFYRMRNFRFAWFNKEGLIEHAGHFINLLRASEAELPERYFSTLTVLQTLYDSVQINFNGLGKTDSLTVELELRLTSSFFGFVRKVFHGLDEQTVRTIEWYIPRKKIQYPELLDSILHRQFDMASVEIPVFHMYKDLKKFLLKYSDLSKGDKWETIPYLKNELRKSEKNVVLISIKKRLWQLEDLSEIDTSSVFTIECENAIKNFQSRMGMKADGIINRSFIDAINVSLESRIRTILINMERCRWIPLATGNKFVVINLPEFKMHVFENAKMLWSSNVIIGKAGLNTVIFTQNLKYIVFSPYWNVPYSIFVNEILPVIKVEPDYLIRHNMEIVSRSADNRVIDPATLDWSIYPGIRFPYLIRQRPGENNSLGLVKFLFPNSYSMYLHDTPNKNLFKEEKRTFSHGCVRVEEPLKLVEFLLRNDTIWTEDSIQSAMNSGIQKYVTLKEEVPVIIVYFTSWVDEMGRLNFRDDIYGHDKKLESILFEMD